MIVALPTPALSGLATQWAWQPLALAAAALLSGWYAWRVRAVRRAGQPWPGGRIALFVFGVALMLWTTCGFAGAYVDSLFWVWTAQQLTLLLVVPYLILAGGPLELAGPGARRLLERRIVRFFANPLIGPALVPLLSVVLFFGPLPGWAIATPALGWIEQLVLVGIGAVIVLPLAGVTTPRSSLAVGLALAIGSFELVLDAVPGIALRLHRSLSTSYFDHRTTHSWSPVALHDQQTAGAVLWCVSELIDLPFLVLVFRQWIKADARDAAEVDAVLDAERIARGEGEPEVEGEKGPLDAPWWLSDPSMQDRFRRR